MDLSRILPAALLALAAAACRSSPDPFEDVREEGEVVLHVSADGRPGAPGTWAAPLDSIRTAMERRTEAPTLIALGAGRHLVPAEGLWVQSALRLVGLGQEETVLVGEDGDAGPAFRASIGGAMAPDVPFELARLSIEGGTGSELVGILDGRAVLRDVEIRGSGPGGLFINADQFLLEDLRITDIGPAAGSPEGAFEATRGPVALELRNDLAGFREPDTALRRVEISDIRGIGILAFGDAGFLRLTVEDLVVRGVRPADPRGDGVGAWLAVRTSAEITAGLVEDVVGTGLILTAWSGATVDGLTVRDVRSGWEPASGRGLILSRGSLRGGGLRVHDTGGPGMSILGVSTARLQGASFARNGFAAISQLQGSLELVGGELVDPQASPAHGGGVGVFAWGDFPEEESGGSGSPTQGVVLRGTAVRGAPGAAVYLRAWEDRVLLEDLDVSDCGSGVFGAWDAPLRSPHLELLSSRFRNLRGDAALLEGRPRITMLDNTWEGLGGEPLHLQRCGPEPKDAPAGAPSRIQPDASAACRALFRETRPMLTFRGTLSESEIPR